MEFEMKSHQFPFRIHALPYIHTFVCLCYMHKHRYS